MRHSKEMNVNQLMPITVDNGEIPIILLRKMQKNTWHELARIL
jgi:hypothetical protein